MNSVPTTPSTRSVITPCETVEKSEPVLYACQRCTACCRWPGQVKLRSSEVDAIAAFLDMDVLAFTEKYTRLRPGRDGLSLTEQADGACIFLDGMDCAIQSVKPAQCREFPNKWNFPGWREICKAIPVGSDVPAIPQTESARE